MVSIRDEILREVSNSTGVDASLIMSHCRWQTVVRARRQVIRRLRELGLSYPEIGRLMGRDHTTVMHALRPRVRTEEQKQRAKWLRYTKEES